jgi:hypothetical protein
VILVGGDICDLTFIVFRVEWERKLSVLFSGSLVM